MFPSGLSARTADLLALCREKSLLLATAESCTGGLLSALLTSIPGSSDVLDAGFVTYSNQAKSGMLGVPAELIAAHGAVSEEVARAMATGAIARSRASVAIAITGIAGPGGGTQTKPVGLVWLACATNAAEVGVRKQHLGNLGRDAIRLAAVEAAIGMLYDAAAALP